MTDTSAIADTHEHEWGEVETSRFTGNPHRKCKGCREITMDLQFHEETLGSCGCIDYHMADCPTRTGGREADDYQDDPYENERW